MGTDFLDKEVKRVGTVEFCRDNHSLLEHERQSQILSNVETWKKYRQQSEDVKYLHEKRNQKPWRHSFVTSWLSVIDGLVVIVWFRPLLEGY